MRVGGCRDVGKWVWGPQTVGMRFGMFIPPKNDTLGERGFGLVPPTFGGPGIWLPPPQGFVGFGFGLIPAKKKKSNVGLRWACPPPKSWQIWAVPLKGLVGLRFGLASPSKKKHCGAGVSVNSPKKGLWDQGLG